LAADVDQIEVEILVAFLYETCNLFEAMGSAMAMAFSGKNRLLYVNRYN